MAAAALLLLLRILQLSTVLRIAAGAGADGGEPYQVVRPVRLHTVHRRDVEHSRPDALRYAMTVGGRDVEMHLQRNRELLSDDYSETYYDNDGNPVTTTPTNIDHCYYHGQIVNDSQSTASISTCDGLRGFIRTGVQHYAIEPLVGAAGAGQDEGDHALTALGAGPPGAPGTPMLCGVTNTTWDTEFEPPTGRSRSRAAGPNLLQKQKYLELILVADNREYVKMKRNEQALRTRLFEVVNFLNMVYKPINTFVALVGLEVWSNGDQISVTSPSGDTLGTFNDWRNNVLVKRKKHDNAHLISGIDFDGATVGLAYVGTLCSTHSSGIVQDHTDRAIAIGATLAHEMGHNLGMSHDDSSACACSGDSCIMAGALSYDTPRDFSSCSTANYERFLTTRNHACLLNRPSAARLVPPSKCGNGFLEKGEDCDCGLLEECTNPCCNATTCKLTTGSQCSFGECCENCKILPRSRVCRRQEDECDLAEYCDGSGDACPENVFTVNGVPCDQGNGYCYNGQCPQREDQCVKMYGPAAGVARQYCYNSNERGTYYAYCKRLDNDKHVPCQPQDVMCGKLFCSGGNDDPSYGRMVSFSDCKASFFAEASADFGQVDTGTKCEEGKVCSQNECVDVQTAYSAFTNCSAKCPGHAVCNHRAECQCEPGWTEPHCGAKDQDFQGISSEVQTAIIVVVVLLVLGALAVVMAILYRRRRNPMLPVVASQGKTREVNNPGFRGNIGVPSSTPPLHRPVVAPPPPPPAGNRPKPTAPGYSAARQALRPVPPPKPR